MVKVGVIFELRCVRTLPGESVIVCGDAPALGAWNPDAESTASSLEMRTGAPLYPRWTLPRPVWIELDDDACSTEKDFTLFYKYLRDRRILGASGLQWEDAPYCNRSVTLPRADRSLWIVSDGVWGSDKEPARVTRTQAREVISRLSNFDAEWACLSPARNRGPTVFEMTPHCVIEMPTQEDSSSEEDFDHYAIEDEFGALSRLPVKRARSVSFFPEQSPVSWYSCADLELQCTQALVDELARENEALRQKLKLLTSPTSVKEPQEEPQVVDDEELILG